jgi:ABC-type spermidine/putrescine transport system permease subunit I
MAKKKVSKKRVSKTSSAKSHRAKANSNPLVNPRIPLGVKVISVLYYIYAGLFVLMGIFFVIGSSYIVTEFNKALESSQITEDISLMTELVTSTNIVIFGIALIISAIVAFIVARGLWKRKKWARMVVIIISIIAVLSSIIDLELFRLAINAVIGAYLIFSKEVKQAFK